MNQIIAASKSHYGQYSSMKNKFTNMVAMHAKKQELPVFERVSVTITWYCKKKRQDPDNIATGEKFILDGLVKAGKLPNDVWKQFKELKHHFEVDKNERVEIILKEEA
ncbi:MAG TPA: Holliday junction resolvase [Bacillales bacterium]